MRAKGEIGFWVFVDSRMFLEVPPELAKLRLANSEVYRIRYDSKTFSSGMT